MDILIENDRLKSTAKKISNMSDIDKYDIYMGLDHTGEAVASAISFAKGKPCITKELVERSDNALEHDLNLLMIFLAKEIGTDELISLIKIYRIKGFQIGRIISLGAPETETENELKMLGVKVMQVDY
ncbi:hypothetical protein GQ472_03410 [archaeon]|nr:hypothetical protein [archaeon]